QITGVDGGNTTFFTTDYAGDPDAFPNFFGTSAATPAVAGIAALVLEEARRHAFTLSPTALYGVLTSTAVDIHTPGYDDLTGFGRVDAVRALAAASSLPEPASAGLTLM